MKRNLIIVALTLVTALMVTPTYAQNTIALKSDHVVGDLYRLFRATGGDSVAMNSDGYCNNRVTFAPDSTWEHGTELYFRVEGTTFRYQIFHPGKPFEPIVELDLTKDTRKLTELVKSLSGKTVRFTTTSGTIKYVVAKS